MKDFHVLPVSRLLSSAGGLLRQTGDVWKAQAEEESLGREGRRESAPCIQNSGEQAGCAATLLLKPNLKATDFPLIFKQVKNSLLPSYYCRYPQRLQLESDPPVPGMLSLKVPEPLCQGLQPNRSRQTDSTSALLSQ